MPSAIVPITDGSEEMEAVIIIDVLRRANWTVVAAGVGGTAITASRGVRLLADAAWEDVDPAQYEVILLPGGARGAARLGDDAAVLETLRRFHAQGKLVGAICAAPLALQKAGLLEGRRATCHPAVRGELTSARYCADRVVVDGNIITSQGPGTAFEFALKVIAIKEGPAAAAAVAEGLVPP
ncbi:MAG: DJ-1/PfpI family protein [Lentisphaerae bacterium]|nr:DJ-1/PfpI family protein [Lentisphaerota bacterium]